VKRGQVDSSKPSDGAYRVRRYSLTPVVSWESKGRE
jgi:hypothetical protein